MLAMNSDIYCIQEVSNTVANPSIATLVSLLGSDSWEGRIVPSSPEECDQRQGIIYKKSKVEYVSASQLNSGNPAQGNSYSYNWSGGRYPALYNVNLVAGNVLIPLLLINIHAKAEDGSAMSYTRRLGGSEALKTILDGVNFNSKNLVVIGDFNDHLIGTTSNTCGCSVSPYQNFMDDQASYSGVTKEIIDANWAQPLIENIIISNELAGNYISGSAVQEVAVPQNISSYYNTTSNHLPVSAVFQFSVLENREYLDAESFWAIYPNPVRDELRFDTRGLENDAVVEIYDLTGRRMRYEKIDADTVGVTGLPSGIYIVKAGKKCARFVKE